MRAYSVFANDGKTVEPYLIEKSLIKKQTKLHIKVKTEYSEQIFSSQTVQHVRDLLKGVVTESMGTAKKFNLDNGVQIIGKTGTGQVVVDGGYSSTIYTKSFSGMAPYEDPQIIVNIVFKVLIMIQLNIRQMLLKV